MTEPFHYRPLSEVIAEYEKDPNKKKILEEMRASMPTLMKLMTNTTSLNPLVEAVLENQFRGIAAQDVADESKQND